MQDNFHRDGGDIGLRFPIKACCVLYGIGLIIPSILTICAVNIDTSFTEVDEIKNVPWIRPEANEILEIEIRPNGTILFPNGTEREEPVVFLRAGRSAMGFEVRP